jgi:hypothetical protein
LSFCFDSSLPSIFGFCVATEHCTVLFVPPCTLLTLFFCEGNLEEKKARRKVEKRTCHVDHS